MPVRSCSAVLVAVSLFACVDQDAPARSVPRNLIQHADAITSQYIVVFDDVSPTTRAARDLDDTIDVLAARHTATVERRYEAVLRGFAARMSAQDAAALAAEPGVLYVEQDTPVYASAVQANPTYGLDRIDQPNLPLDAMYQFATDGLGSTVFVIDTGINTTHVEFTGHLRADLGATAIDDDNGIEDCNGHGTHVSGTIAGTVYGVAKKATIVPVRVLDCEGTGASSGVIAGMDFVAMNHPARSVVNMSLGGAAGDAKDAAVRNLVAAGVTVVVAAGNETQDACNTSPAREPMAITVASTTSTDARSSFSNFGTCVDLFAPGSSITSAWIDSNTATNTISGTSMASPHVAGAAALFLALNPNATPGQVTAAIVGSAVANKVTDPNGSPNKLLQTTFGAAPPPPPPGGAVKITSPADGAEVGTMFEITIDASGAARVDLAMDGGAPVSDQTAPYAFTASNVTPGVHQLVATSVDSGGKAATHAITVTVKSAGLGGGNNPVPPPMRHKGAGGCSATSTTGGGLWFGMVLAVLLATLRVRDKRNQRLSGIWCWQGGRRH